VRILHVENLPSRPGGVSSYIAALSEQQRRSGHEVSVFGCSDAADAPGDLPEYFDFTATHNPLALARMIHNAPAAGKLNRLLRGGRVDVAHLHNIYHHLSPAILPVLARHRVAMVMTLHDYRLACPTKHFLCNGGVCTRCVPHGLHHAAGRGCAGLGGAALAAESLVQRLARTYFGRVDFFLCPTRFMRRLMRRINMPASKAVVVPNPVVAPPSPASRPPTARRLLYAGRLSREKGPDLMLDLAAGIPDAQVTVAGAGPLLDELTAQAGRDGINNITFTGQVDRGRLGRLVAGSAAVVLPSRCLDNSPQTMLEAMAAGRCVVAPDHEPLREWVRDGQTGRLFSPGDRACLVRVAREVLDDSAARDRMGRAAKKLVRTRHDRPAVAKQIDELYRKAIARCALRW